MPDGKTVFDYTSPVQQSEPKKKRKKENKKEAPKTAVLIVIGRRGNLKK